MFLLILNWYLIMRESSVTILSFLFLPFEGSVASGSFADDAANRLFDLDLDGFILPRSVNRENVVKTFQKSCYTFLKRRKSSCNVENVEKTSFKTEEHNFKLQTGEGLINSSLIRSCLLASENLISICTLIKKRKQLSLFEGSTGFFSSE